MPRTESKIVNALILMPIILQACNGLVPPVQARTPYPTPPEWATPGGLETAIAGFDATATHVALIEENETNAESTPMPDSLTRLSISMCTETKQIEACVSSISVDYLQQKIADWYVFFEKNKNNGNISRQSSETILSAIGVLITEIQNFKTGVPGSISIDPYESLFPEAEGGVTIMNWGINTPPTIQLFLPQTKSLEDPDSIHTSATLVHEWLHAAWAIKHWRQTGSFDKGDSMPEELQAEFFDSVSEIFLAKSLGLIDNTVYRSSIEDKIKLDGSYLPFIGWYLDSQGVSPESSLWKILYETHSYYFNSSMALQYGYITTYKEEAEKLRVRWKSYPWTPAEIELLNKMFQEGMNQGFIEEFPYPDFPE